MPLSPGSNTPNTPKATDTSTVVEAKHSDEKLAMTEKGGVSTMSPALVVPDAN